MLRRPRRETGLDGKSRLWLCQKNEPWIFALVSSTPFRSPGVTAADEGTAKSGWGRVKFEW